MNKLFRHITLCSLVATAAYANTVTTENVTDFDAWRHASREKLEALNGGHTGKLITFIREHTDELTAELLSLVNRSNPTAHAAYYAELVQCLDTMEALSATNPFVAGTTKGEFLHNSNRIAMMKNFSTWWAATKTYLEQILAPEECPVLHGAFKQYAPVFESIVEDFMALEEQQAQAHADDQIPVLDESMHQMIVQSLIICKVMIQSAYEYMQTEQHTTLLQQLIVAWSGLMKEDAFFEAVQTKNVLSIYPASLDAFIRAIDAYGQAFQSAVLPVVAEDAQDDWLTLEEDAGYDADTETEDTCGECDFSVQFKKRHAK